MFFILSSSAKPKPGRPKKGRTSKPARLSTVSNITAVSAGRDVAESQENEGITTMMSPTGSVISGKTGKGSKKGGKAKRSTAKPKCKLVSTTAEELVQASSFIEPEDDDFEVKIEPNTKKSTRSRKRNSDEISVDTKDTAINDQRVEIADPRPPPAKRRATRTRSSVAQSTIVPVLTQESHDDDMHMTDTVTMPPPSAPASKKGVKGSRNRASSAVRKASATSTASMASLRATIPDDDDIDAALEAGLDRPLTDDEKEDEQLEVIYPKTRRLTRTKPGSRNATASVAPVRRTTRTSVMTTDSAPTGNGDFSQSSLLELDSTGGAALQSDLIAEEAVSILPVKLKATKGKNTRKASAKQPTPRDTNVAHKEHTVDKLAVHEDEALVPEPSRSRQPSRQLPQRRTRASDLATALEKVNLSSSVNNSMLKSFTAEDDSGHETDRSVASQGRVKRGKRTGSVASIKGKAGKKAPLMSQWIEGIIQPSTDDTASVPEPETLMESGHLGPADTETTASRSIEEEIEPKKKSTKSTKGKANKQALKKTQPSKLSSPPAESPKRPLADHPASITQDADTDDTPFNPAQPDHEAMSPTTKVTVSSLAPLPSARTTPKQTSPRQSSDVENEPPSSRPSRIRPPLSACSPLNSQTTRIPVAASTPITSPSKHNISKLQSSFPWTAVGFEKFFSTAEGDKENEASVFQTDVGRVTGGLPSPEKQMSVEQWILFNAKKSEEKLRSECERLVGKFEGEGVRALQTLEGIACVD